MNINIMNERGFYASVSGSGESGKQIHWGFSVREEHGKGFDINYANELLDFANKEYKKSVRMDMIKRLMIHQ